MNAAELVARLKNSSPEQIKAALSGFTDRDAVSLLYNWRFWARAEQLAPPGEWETWLILAGRGWGKTRTGAETVLGWMMEQPGCRIALVGATAADVRDTMLDGESGLLNIAPPWFPLHYEPSKRRVTAKNGARCTCFSAEEPAGLRGPQFHKAWADELAAWYEPQTGDEAVADDPWEMLQFCVRLKPNPQIVVTTTPKPTSRIVKLATQTVNVHVTKGHTLDNRQNLAKTFLTKITDMYKGTRLGKQELAGDLLLDTPGSLFPERLLIETAIPTEKASRSEYERTIIAVDPAPTSNIGSDQTGIVAEALGADGHVYWIEDATIGGSPDAWARAVVAAFYRHSASYVVAEINMGGEMVESTIHTVDPNVPVKMVRAMKGKAKRAEPVAAKLEQRKIHIVGDPTGEKWSKFVNQAKRFTGIHHRRDDRIDAACWGVHELLFSDGFVGGADKSQDEKEKAAPVALSPYEVAMQLNQAA